MIDVTLLGTSALLPLPDRALTAAVIECAGHSVLLDCGEGTQTAARRAGISLMKTDVIALTHYHGDHIFGLPGLLQTLFCMGRTQPLYITGPAGLCEAMSPILTLAGHLPYEIRLMETPAEGISLRELCGGWPHGAALASFQTAHRVASQGYVFTLNRSGRFIPQKAMALGIPVDRWGLLQKGQNVEWNGRMIDPTEVLGEPRKGLKVVFSGDTSACNSLKEAANHADLLIAEATYAEDTQRELAEERGHMVFSQAAALAGASQVRTLWLTHYSQIIEDPEAFLPNARHIFENTCCGYDGMRTILRFEKETLDNKA